MINDPYQIMGLAVGADADAIRQRYLELVRQFPPERDPEKFAEVRAAYDAVRNPVLSLEHRLFDERGSMTFTEILRHAEPDVRARRIPTDILLSLGKK